MANELFRDEWCTVTTATVAAGSASYALASVAGVRVGSYRQGGGAGALGWIAFYFAFHFAACGTVCTAGGSEKTGPEMLMYGGIAFVVALALITWSRTAAPQYFVVFLNLGGSEVALVQYASESAANETANAILTAKSVGT